VLGEALASILKKALPDSIKQFLVYHRFSHLADGRKFICPVCESKIRRFNMLDDGLVKSLDDHCYQHSIFAGETFSVSSYSCPKCGSADRERLYALYLNQRLRSSPNNKYHLLDIAPNAALQQRIRSFSTIDYRSCDMFRERVDDVIDIQDMRYESNRFDILICSHVLEHVEDDTRAMSELYRVLRPSGWGIVMVPIMLTIAHTLEDPDIKTEADRWKFYGQGDHLRLYAKEDFVAKLQSVGFKVSQLGVDYFGEEVLDKAGVSRRSVLYVVSKL